MRISILTPDSKQPNLAAMKISAWHKTQGDIVELNMPLLPADFTYASLLFKSTQDPHADLIGGPKYPDSKLDPEIDSMCPDYSLYSDIDYSLGYTYRACPRTCDFCIVPKQNNSETHHSIWEFHDKRFNKICLLNNNTLADPYWRDTFQEIIDANLTVIDHGYDARLITDESAWYISQIKFENAIHLAWDFPEHKQEVLRGIKHLHRYGVKRLMVYVLIGNGTTHKENIYRVLRLKSLGVDSFVMPMDKLNTYQKRFARWVNHKAIFKTIKWEDYK